MSEEKTMKIRFTDEDHVYIEGGQFISLNRFLKAKEDLMKEIYLVNDENKELAKENKALKVLLKNQFNER